jgi:acrylyl-CoA reductase (NADPH)
MIGDTFRALVLNQNAGQVEAAFQILSRRDLPAGDVLVEVVYSSLNYKDGLAVTGKGKVVRSYPMIPGVDLAGRVVESSAPEVKVGDDIIVIGQGLGERHWGGYAQMARLKAEAVTALPAGLTLKQAMAIGTAGFTAMLSVMALEAHGLRPDSREVVVTGASGGVGSMAVAILARLGYNVVASTGRPESHDYLKQLGAQTILDRAVLATPSGKPLDSARWAGAVDTVGGETLASLLRSMAYRASVAACGLVGGSNLPTTVFPFILRGVNLLGIESTASPAEERHQAWARLVRDLPLDLLEHITQVAPLSDIFGWSDQILKGQVRGRVVVDVKA